MKAEQNYDFRREVCRIHKRIYNWKSRTPQSDELMLKDGLTISCSTRGPVARTALKDFQGYLKTAFGFRSKVVEGMAEITIAIDPDLREYMQRRVTVDKTGVTIAAADERGVAQALYTLEDRLNTRQAPFLACGHSEQKPAFSPRMVHSGLGIDLYPDEYLSVCAHHGYDAVLVFVRDTTHAGLRNREYDFNDLVRRAANYGIDVYAYSYIQNPVHPDDENARESFDRAYGDVFRAVPGLKGMVFVGESVRFPSKDPCVERFGGAKDGIPSNKPSSGWWPCCDYAEWIGMARDSIRSVKPDADVVLWTYNWGKQPEEARVALLERLPTDISLLVTFEMFDPLELGSSTGWVSDYTIAHVGPGAYFTSEAAVAKRRGLRLYAMVNTAGRTWDFGSAPYEPFPWQWHARHQKILECRQQYGVCGLMESHHFGFLPSFISEQAKQAFTVGGKEFEQYLTDWAKGLAGEQWQTLLEGIRLVDESIRSYVPGNENQYGPYRIGPAYPFCLKRSMKKTNTPDMMFGNAIYNVVNNYADHKKVSPYSLRIRDELKLHRKALACTREGLKTLKGIKNKTSQLKKLVDLVDFLAHYHQTAVNHKQFTICRAKLLASGCEQEIGRLADEIERIARREIKNAEQTIPLVRRNSEFGYEPSMEYQCDEECLRWKIRQVEFMLQSELAPYRHKHDLSM